MSRLHTTTQHRQINIVSVSLNYCYCSEHGLSILSLFDDEFLLLYYKFDIKQVHSSVNIHVWFNAN